jgi:DNA repair protein RadA/Sms
MKSLEPLILLPPSQQGSENSDDSRRESTIEIIPSGFSNLDSVYNGGLQAGSVTLCTAPAGTAKTTIALQIASHLVTGGRQVFYVSGEESPPLLNGKAYRFGISEKMPELFFGKTIFEVIVLASKKRPLAVFIDSIQTLNGGKLYQSTIKQQIHISMMMRRMADEFGCIVWANCQMNKNMRHSGPQALIHNSDVHLELRRGINDEIIAGTPDKNRLGPCGKRAVFRMTDNGLVEIPENETGFLLRYQRATACGTSAFVTETADGYSVDELTVTLDTISQKGGIIIEGVSKNHTDFLTSVIQKYFREFDPACIARANLTEKPSRSVDLAAIMAVLSYYHKRPIPFDTVFLASIDAEGILIPLPDMAQRAGRAYSQGYRQIFGPKAIGSQRADWTEAATISDVWQALG